MSSLRPRRDRPSRDIERGAVFIEFALAVPFLVLIAMGIVEYGLGWAAANDVNAAARDAARAGSASTNYVTADKIMLQTIGASLSNDELDHLQKVIVYQAANADDTRPPSRCLDFSNTSGSATNIGAAVGVGSPQSCNVYGKGQIEYALNPANTSDVPYWVNSTGTNCGTGASSVDKFWCPARRNHSKTTDNLDYIGVYIKVKHESVTNVGFGDQMIERTAVFRLEPEYGG
jgi:Flp pilus assembly protein TadG